MTTGPDVLEDVDPPSGDPYEDAPNGDDDADT